MTVGSVDLAVIQQTLSEMQSAAGAATSASGPALPSDSATFAASLAEATSSAALTDALAGASDDALFGEASADGQADLAGTSPAVPDDGLDLLAMLLSAQQGSAGESASVDDPPGAGGVTGQEVVNEAAQMEGVPYQWGGTTPGGFDCSGLVQYVYRQLGVELPRTSEEQATVGTQVASLSDAQPGDLIFFAGSDGTAAAPGHVGIYMGDGQMIDAPHTGTTVQVQSVSSAGPVVAIRRALPTGAPSGDSLMGNVAVPPAYASTIAQAASSNGIPPALLAAVLSHESGFDPTAVSSAGAEGIAQFMPATASGMGIDPYDPVQAINGAAQLLGSYLLKFGSYADALAAYDAGPAAVERYGGVPPYAETEAYVPAVLGLAGIPGAQETAP
jgi:cell wall-associated NlpC family hydrolase